MFYTTPFSKAYWRQAAREMKNTKMLVFAGLMIALRVVFKQISIPIGPTLRINTAFIVNALGAMVMGPVLSLLAAAVTDTLGALLFPTGVYFFPFIFVEMAGSLIFALFLYRTQVTPKRLILSRFCINLFVNILLQTPIMMLYYQMILGSYYAPIDLVRFAKNLTLFPLEALVLMVVFRPMIPTLRRMGFAVSGAEDLRLTGKRAVLIVSLSLVSAMAIGGFFWLDYNNTSLSAGYTPEQRLARNTALGEMEISQHPELREEGDIVCIIESAYPKAFSPEVTYNLAVYRADVSGAENPEALLAELRGLSKSRAAKREELTLVRKDTIVLTENGQEPEKSVKGDSGQETEKHATTDSGQHSEKTVTTQEAGQEGTGT